MDLTRREVLKLVGVTALGAVAFNGCLYPARELWVESPHRIPEDLVTGVDNWYATLCRQCGSAEGVLVRVVEGRAKKVEGNPDYPTNQGKSFARCQTAVQELYHPDRLTRPLRRGQPVDWEGALGELAARLRSARTVVVATRPVRGSQALLLRRFTEALGARHLTLDPTGEHARVREAVRRAFGSPLIPHFDIQNTRTLLSFGAGFLDTWLSPVNYGRQYGAFRGARPRGYFVHAEPRMSMTASNADRWLPVRPGTEGVLALSIAYVLMEEGLAERDASARMTGGRGPEVLSAFRPEEAERITGVSAETIREVARRFGKERPSLALAGGPAGAVTNGLENLVSAFLLNHLVGSVGRKGGVLLNPLPPLEEAETRALPPLSTLADWRALIEEMDAGRVDVLILRGVNPIHELPAILGFRFALERVPFVVQIASVPDEVTPLAHLVLPEHTGLEDWGDDIPDPGPGYPVVGVQQPVVRPIHSTLGFADILLAVAGRLGLGLPWETGRDLVAETARALYETGRGSVRGRTFEDFWVGLLARGGWWDPEAGPARPGDPPALPTALSTPRTEGEGEFHLLPYVHIGLGVGETAHLPWLQNMPEPLTTAVWTTWVEMSPATAQRLGVVEGDVVRVEGPSGAMEAPVLYHFASPPDVVAVPMGQGHTAYTRYAQNRGANPLTVVAPTQEEATGTFAWASNRVRLSFTGKKTRVPRFQGTVPAIQLPEKEIVPVVPPEEA